MAVASQQKICVLLLVLSLSARIDGEERLRVIVRESYLPGVSHLLRLEVRDAEGNIAQGFWDGEARVSARGRDASVSPSRVRLRNGVGSALLRLAGEGELELVVTLDDLSGTARLRDGRGDPVRVVSGRLPAGSTDWSGIVRVAADVEVPSQATLRLLPGTLVLLDGVPEGEDGAAIDVHGRLEVAGTAARPVTLTAGDAELPWGQLSLHPGAEGVMTYAHLTRGGHSPGVPIATGGPVIRIDEASLAGESVAITDQDGQGIYAVGGRVELRECLLARCVVGIQADGSDVLLAGCQITEIVGETDEDDNDFLHLSGATGAEEVRLEDCVFAFGSDDALDLHEIDGVEVERCIFRELGDKGVSLFHEELFIRRCLFVDNRTAISTKAGDSALTRVHVERSTLVDNLVSIEARDKFGVPNARIRYDVVSSILRRRDDAASRIVRTDYDPDFITIRYSNSSDAWDEGESRGISTEDPRFVDRPAHDYHLKPDSPCIDRGDPDASDPDGSRADQGAFPFTGTDAPPRFVRGDANGDRKVDIADPVSVFFYLAFNVPLECVDAADADDSGDLDLTDGLWLLNYLFLGGATPPPPFAACGNDPTVDALECRGVAEC